MANRKTSKKVTRVEGGEGASSKNDASPFEITAESKARAKQLRIIAIISWIVAIGLEVVAIMLLQKKPVSILWLIVTIVADVIFVIIGSLLWKKANRLDPASEKDKTRFFIQNQLGLIMSVLALLPLVVLVFTNKNMDSKQKGIVGSVAVVGLLVAAYFGIDFNPPSIEQYQEQTAKVEALNNGNNLVYWTKSGKSYHLFEDCSYINTARTTEIFEGTVAQSRELKNITDLCNRCENRAIKEQGILEESLETEGEENS